MRQSRKIRLDQLLFQKGLAESREKARALIMAGVTEVDGIRVDKPGSLIPDNASISLKKTCPSFVGRGGIKLEAGLKQFAVEVQGLVLLDVGYDNLNLLEMLVYVTPVSYLHYLNLHLIPTQ